MAHRIDIDSLHQTVFLMLNVCYGAKGFAQHHDVRDESESDPVSGSYYVGWLRFTLSERLIDSAIKVRILLDTLGSLERDGIKFGLSQSVAELNRSISADFCIGHLTGSEDALSLREACNKIIHADDIELHTEPGDDEHYLDEETAEKRYWAYWRGGLDLYGRKDKLDWHASLYVEQFYLALAELLSTIDGSVDWKRVYKSADMLE